MGILQWLESSNIIAHYDVIDYKIWKTGRYYKITIYLKNSSVLHAKEYFDLNERNYSFHWQDKDGNLLIRWDNSPHHSHIKTHPHHKHQVEKIFDSYDISLNNVLKYIEKIIHTNK